MSVNTTLNRNIQIVVIATLVIVLSYSDSVSCNIQTFDSTFKIVSFNTIDDDVKVQSKFIVPFLTAARNNRTNYGRNGLDQGIVNLNLAAVTLGGILKVAAASFSTTLTSAGNAFFRTYPFRTNKGIDFFHHGEYIYERQQENTLTTCMNLALCLRLQKAFVNTHFRNASPMDKVIDGFTSIPMVADFLDTSIFGEALYAAKANSSCVFQYGNCLTAVRGR